MKMSHVRAAVAVVALSGLGITTLLSADEPATQPGKERTIAKPVAVQEHGNLDQHFAACLVLANQNEVAGARLAQQRSKSPEVKSFAQTLEKEHQLFITELQKFGGKQFQSRTSGQTTEASRIDSRTENAKTVKPAERAAVIEPTAGERRTDAKPRAVTDGNKAVIHGDNLATADTLLQIKQEMADECLASMERELSGKEGREFDACFIGMQLAGHMHMVDELKVLERHATADLQGTLRKGRETAQKHLERAREIMKDIDKHETKTAASK